MNFLGEIKFKKFTILVLKCNVLVDLSAMDALPKFDLCLQKQKSSLNIFTLCIGCAMHALRFDI